MIRLLKQKLKPIIFRNQRTYYDYCRLRARKEKEMVILPSLLKHKKGIALDIGANLGLYTSLLSKKCKMKVHAFEPQYSLYQYNKSKGYKNVTLHNVALSDNESTMDLNIPYSKSTGKNINLATLQALNEPHKKETVNVKTLDSYNFTDVDFIKIDVEGFEGNVIAGGKETINKCSPILLVEIEQRHLKRDQNGGGEVTAVIELIQNMGYKSYYYADNKFFETAQLNINEAQSIKYLNTKKYINNFFFFPKEVKV